MSGCVPSGRAVSGSASAGRERPSGRLLLSALLRASAASRAATASCTVMATASPAPEICAPSPGPDSRILRAARQIGHQAHSGDSPRSGGGSVVAVRRDVGRVIAAAAAERPADLALNLPAHALRAGADQPALEARTAGRRPAAAGLRDRAPDPAAGAAARVAPALAAPARGARGAPDGAAGWLAACCRLSPAAGAGPPRTASCLPPDRPTPAPPSCASPAPESPVRAGSPAGPVLAAPSTAVAQTSRPSRLPGAGSPLPDGPAAAEPPPAGPPAAGPPAAGLPAAGLPRSAGSGWPLPALSGMSLTPGGCVAARSAGRWRLGAGLEAFQCRIDDRLLRSPPEHADHRHPGADRKLVRHICP